MLCCPMLQLVGQDPGRFDDDEEYEGEEEEGMDEEVEQREQEKA